MQKLARPIHKMQKKFLMMVASEILGMPDVAIAEVFNTTKQNVSKILKPVTKKKEKEL